MIGKPRPLPQFYHAISTLLPSQRGQVSEDRFVSHPCPYPVSSPLNVLPISAELQLQRFPNLSVPQSQQDTAS